MIAIVKDWMKPTPEAIREEVLKLDADDRQSFVDLVIAEAEPFWAAYFSRPKVTLENSQELRRCVYEIMTRNG